jgi:hypothetical protein
MFYLAKTLQAGAMSLLPMALYIGMVKNDVTTELKLLAGAGVLFVVGRALESRAAS